MNLTCEMNLCVFNKNKTCRLKNVNLSCNGMCDKVVFPDFDEILELIKSKTLKSLLRRRKFTYSYLFEQGALDHLLEEENIKP